MWVDIACSVKLSYHSVCPHQTKLPLKITQFNYMYYNTDYYGGVHLNLSMHQNYR